MHMEAAQRRKHPDYVANRQGGLALLLNIAHGIPRHHLHVEWRQFRLEDAQMVRIILSNGLHQCSKHRERLVEVHHLPFQPANPLWHMPYF